jgi:hypothetical protein
MSLFEPMRDFYHRREAIKLSERAGRIDLVNRRQESPRGSFVFPGTDYLDDIEVGGEHVGHVDYGLSPLGDRLYINMLDIDVARRKKGIGLSVLWHLWSTHQLPIVPLDQCTSSDGFWYRARLRLATAGAVLAAELRGDVQREEEQQRWQHLVPESENDRSQRKYWAWVAAEHAAGRPAGPGI